MSQQIRELEEDLGVTLFERRGRGLALTPAGERLLTHATSLVRDLKQARTDVSAFAGVAQGVLRVGASHTPGVYLLPHALGRFSQRFPGIRPSLAVGDADVILGLLQDGEVDLALVAEDPRPSQIVGWDKVPFIEDELVLVAGPEHPWAHRGVIRVDELAEYPIIFRQPTSKTRQLILDCLAQAGLAPESLATRFELGNTEGIKHATMAGLGVGFVSRHAATIECRAGLLHVVGIAGVAITRTVWLVRPRPEKSVPHLERFCELLFAKDWLPGVPGVPVYPEAGMGARP